MVLLAMLHGSVALAADLTALQSEGRALYRGTHALTNAPTMHDVALPQAGGCARCHGEAGSGAREAGVQVPPIDVATLTAPRRGTSAYATTAAALAGLARGQGRDALLNVAMPRYQFTEIEIIKLAAYLDVIGTSASTFDGVSPQKIRIGTLVPGEGVLAAVGQKIEAGLREQIAEINRAGGVYGRHLELVVESLTGGAEAGRNDTAYANALARLQARDVFAVVGAWQPPHVLDATEAPMVASLGLAATRVQAHSQRYLLASLQDQITRLVQEMDEHCPPADSPLLVVQGVDSAVGAALAASGVAARKGVRTIASLGDTASGAPTRMLLLGRVSAIENLPNTPCLGRLAALSGATAGAVVATNLSLLPAPSALIEDESAPLWTRLARASVEVFADALRRAGRKLDRAKFAQVLAAPEGLQFSVQTNTQGKKDLKLHFTNRSATGLATPIIISRGSYASYSE